MPYPTNSWAILPATDALFNKTKVSMEQAMLEMGSYGGKGTILICERDNGYDKKPTRLMLSSAGRMDVPIGSFRKAHHDQNLRPYGQLRILDVVFYEIKKGDDGKSQVVTEDALMCPLTLDDKFPLFVFK